MGLLESVLGGLMGGNTNSGMGGVLGSLLSGGGQGGATAGAAMGGGAMGGGAMGGGLGGGLGGLMAQFEQAGLSHVMQSWVGNGANQPVSPSQLQSVFGQGQVNAMADQAGMQPNDFLSQLSQHLPAAVDGMTKGQTDQGSVSV